jgi:signal transduction histidine kinase
VLANVPPRIAERLHGLIDTIQLNLTFLFGLALAFVLLLVNALINERVSQEKLKAANAQLRQSAQEIERLAMAQERSRIARDIHDSLGHSLTALNLQLEGAQKLFAKHPAKAQAFLAEAKRLGSVALSEVRQSVAAIRSDPLQGQSLPDAITALLNNFQQTTGIQPTADLRFPAHVPTNISAVLYRIVQEGLTNIVKHAQASAVSIRLSTQALGATTLIQLVLQDNGQGFELSQTSTGYGLQGIKERAEALKGTVEIKSQPGRGCRCVVKIPLSGFSE